MAVRHLRTRSRERSYRVVLADIAELLRQEGNVALADRIIRDMLVNTNYLRDEGLDIAELKLLNTAFRELRHALKVFSRFRSIPKAAVFGSSRVKREDPNYRLAVEFGRLLAKKGWMVITGGASGIMEAAMVGAGARRSFGLNILLPFEQDANPIIRGSRQLMYFKYFFTRKLMFLKESEATVLFPGGFGTFDEGYESFTLVQTGKAKPRPLVLVDHRGSTFWNSFLSLMRENMEFGGLIDRGDLDLMRHFQDASQAVEEITGFYKNYHSSRFLRDQFLVRVRKKLSPRHFDEMNKLFRDMLERGRFRRLKAIEDEDEKDKRLDRIIFHFDRSSYHALRRLVDWLNGL